MTEERRLPNRQRGKSKNVGADNPKAKLTEGIVRAIRARRAEGISLRALAKEWGLPEGTIGDVCAGRTWKHVTGGVRVERAV